MAFIPVPPVPLPGPLVDLTDCIADVVRKVYDFNASRFDELVGDDTSTFGFNVYRNSWALIENELANAHAWRTARPDGSLVISGCGFHVHVYRHGTTENADLRTFRLDDSDGSATKRTIVNDNQLAFNFDGDAQPAAAPKQLVMVHAGNPEDGCCAVWLGAPLPLSDDDSRSPWAWVVPVWTIARREEGGEVAGGDSGGAGPTPHSDLPEPHVDVRPIEADPEATARRP